MISKNLFEQSLRRKHQFFTVKPGQAYPPFKIALMNLFFNSSGGGTGYPGFLRV